MKINKIKITALAAVTILSGSSALVAIESSTNHTVKINASAPVTAHWIGGSLPSEAWETNGDVPLNTSVYRNGLSWTYKYRTLASVQEYLDSITYVEYSTNHDSTVSSVADDILSFIQGEVPRGYKITIKTGTYNASWKNPLGRPIVKNLSFKASMSTDWDPVYWPTDVPPKQITTPNTPAKEEVKKPEEKPAQPVQPEIHNVNKPEEKPNNNVVTSVPSVQDKPIDAKITTQLLQNFSSPTFTIEQMKEVVANPLITMNQIPVITSYSEILDSQNKVDIVKVDGLVKDLRKVASSARTAFIVDDKKTVTNEEAAKLSGKHQLRLVILFDKPEDVKAIKDLYESNTLGIKATGLNATATSADQIAKAYKFDPSTGTLLANSVIDIKDDANLNQGILPYIHTTIIAAFFAIFGFVAYKSYSKRTTTSKNVKK